MLTFENIKTRLGWGVLFLLGIILTACSSAEPEDAHVLPASERLPHAVSVNPPGGAMMLSGNTIAGDALGSMLLPRLGSGSAVLAATMVDIDDFDKSSSFGRTSMQQIGSRLSQHGFRVLEPRLGASLRFEKRQGEFMLTRESLRLLSRDYDAHAVLIGTYSESYDKVFLSVRVVRLQDNAVIGAYEYYLPKNSDVQALLGANGSYGGSEIWRRHAVREQAFPSK